MRFLRAPRRIVPALFLLLHVVPAPASTRSIPEHFFPYYSGPPCAAGRVDRTYSQFQVNLAEEAELLEGTLRAGDWGDARLVEPAGREIQLVSNASRAEWLLTYPLLEDQVGVWARPIFRPDCSVDAGALYVEAIFPLTLFQDRIDPRLDLFARERGDRLRESVTRYRRALTGNDDGAPGDTSHTRGHGRAARKLQLALFDPEAARGSAPWRVRLMGDEGPVAGGGAITVLLSGSDGSVGMFGHIAVGVNDQVYNVYPKGSDHGAPGPVPLWDYLFNAQRGQALTRPTWVLRLEGLPDDVVSSVDGRMQELTREIREGTSVYHPTANNCTIATLKALRGLGFKVAAGRYFTKRFPRPAFDHVLKQVPDLVESGKLQARRVELWFIPQVPVRISEGGAPNRPLRDRSRMN